MNDIKNDVTKLCFLFNILKKKIIFINKISFEQQNFFQVSTRYEEHLKKEKQYRVDQSEILLLWLNVNLLYSDLDRL